MRSIEDLKTWLESAMDDSMSRKTTMEFVARVIEDVREECAYEAALEMQRGADAKNPGRVLAAMNVKNAIRARNDK